MTEIRISSVDIFKASIPMIAPFRISLGVITEAEYLFVRINTDAGVSGWGEATPLSRITGDTQGINVAAAMDLARLVVGGNPLDIEGRVTEMGRFLAFNTSVRSAFDMALYDVAAKVAGLPLYAFLGGGKRQLETDVTIGIDEPAVMADKAAELKRSGVSALKVKLGTTAEEDVKRIRSIREAVGDELPLRVDANQGWDFPTAVRVLTRLESANIEYCEQPIAHWDLENFKRLRERVSIPIMADESVFDHHDAFKLAAGGCCDFFNIKLAKSAGIHTALKINAVAESCGAKCMLGCMLETRLGLTAAAHLVSAKPNIRYVDLDSHFQLKLDPIVGGARWDGSNITLPDDPGIGAVVDAAFLDGCEHAAVT
jgi:L-alanine-DL-glutamate epimerase-like enolase superfamily enzyme